MTSSHIPPKSQILWKNFADDDEQAFKRTPPKKNMIRRTLSSNPSQNSKSIDQSQIEKQISVNAGKLWTPEDFKIAFMALSENK